MQAPSYQHEVEKHNHGGQRTIDMEPQHSLQEYSTRTDHKSHQWKELGGTRQRIGLERNRWHGNSREKLKGHYYLIT
jgi:hypothetical protein